MRHDGRMRTMLDIDDDVFEAATKIAVSRRLTVGQVLSRLARQALASAPRVGLRNGVPVLPPRRPGARPSTIQLVNVLRD